MSVYIYIYTQDAKPSSSTSRTGQQMCYLKNMKKSTTTWLRHGDLVTVADSWKSRRYVWPNERLGTTDCLLFFNGRVYSDWTVIRVVLFSCWFVEKSSRLLSLIIYDTIFLCIACSRSQSWLYRFIFFDYLLRDIKELIILFHWHLYRYYMMIRFNIVRTFIRGGPSRKYRKALPGG